MCHKKNKLLKIDNESPLNSTQLINELTLLKYYRELVIGVEK